jgi:LmbE family N-acetylglucosaminyl deacetylase
LIKILRIFLIMLLSFYTLLGFFMFYLHSRINIYTDTKEYITVNDDNIVIFAAHQDDGVIMAGGYAMQAIKAGGKVKVFYMFDGEPGNGRKRNITRMNESFRAWELIGIEKRNIHFLDYDEYYGLSDDVEIEECIDEVVDIFKKNNFDKIFIPLYEGGHYQHDIANYIVSRAHIRSGRNGRLYECPEYNAYYSIKNTPEKFLSLLSKLVPLCEYRYPPIFIREGSRLYLDMSDEELMLKREMLQAFKSQDVKGLLDLYGYKDSYQIYTDYDYSKPPFDYDGSIAKHVNSLKTVPVLRSFLWWLFGKTKTRYPDPDYMITRIKIDKEH